MINIDRYNPYRQKLFGSLIIFNYKRVLKTLSPTALCYKRPHNFCVLTGGQTVG